MNNDIQEAKRLLPLPELMKLYGLGDLAKQGALCPFHEDKSESFSVWNAGERGWQFKCHAGCGNGDEITFVEHKEGLSNRDATKRFLELSGVRRSSPVMPSRALSEKKSAITGRLEVSTKEAAPFNWAACVNAFSDDDADKLSEWRGYSMEFCQWLKENSLIGKHGESIAFPVHDDGGTVVGAHYRIKADGSWRYTKGTRVSPLVIGDPASAVMIHIFESQWDAFSACDKLRIHDDPSCAVLITRGAENGALVAGLCRSDAEAFAWPQNDPAEKRNNKTGKTPAQKWLSTIAEKAGVRVHSVSTPDIHADLNDWIKAGAGATELAVAMRSAQVVGGRPRPLIEFRSPSQLQAFVPPSGSVLVGDCHIMRGAVFVIGGAPGVGKSRAGVALAEAGATGCEWFGLPVHRKFKTMIIQNENGEHRLKSEFSELDAGILDPWVRVCIPPLFGLTFDREEFRVALAKEIADFKPDVVIIDPWNAVARDDKASDYLETFRLIRSVIPAGDDGPALGIVAHTRKPKSDERTSGRGLLNLIAGSYVLGSVPRSAFVLQAASDNPEDRHVVWTCCKCNDGELGPRTAWVRCNGLFEAVPDFDWKAFENTGKADRVKITEKEMATVFEDGAKRLTHTEAAKRLMADSIGAGKTLAYDVLKLDGRFEGRLTKDEDGKLSWE